MPGDLELPRLPVQPRLIDRHFRLDHRQADRTAERLKQAQRQAAPLISQLREAVDAIRTAEIERLSGRMVDFTDEQRETVETITRGIVAKLLHQPSVSLREAAGSAQGERLSAAVRDLFDLH